MSKICVINQPAGIGDIFFSMKIAKHMAEQRYEVIWPVIPNFLYLKDYIIEKNINFISINDTYDWQEYFENPQERNILSTNDNTSIYIPLKYADIEFPNVTLMKSKYSLVDIQWEDWADYFNIKRNKERENHLYYDILRLKDNQKFNLINKYYGSPPKSSIKKEVASNSYNSFDNVESVYIPGTNIFDWCKVIEESQAIFSVDTSLQYITEKLNLKYAKDHLYLWCRFPVFDHMDGLYKLNWKQQQ